MPVMPKPTVDNLRAIIHSEVPSDHLQMLFKDAFALGCYLHLQGQKEAGRKMCSEVLSALGYGNRKTYFHTLLESLDGNEIAFALDIWAHNEIVELVRSHPSHDEYARTHYSLNR